VVVKIDVTWPFCVGHHVNIHLDVTIISVTFNKVDVWKIFTTPRLFRYVWQLKMDSIATKLANENEFCHHRIGDLKFSLANFWSPTFNHHS
jgi:hypothetical protein